MEETVKPDVQLNNISGIQNSPAASNPENSTATPALRRSFAPNPEIVKKLSKTSNVKTFSNGESYTLYVYKGKFYYEDGTPTSQFIFENGK
jgi:hypothetical protein